MLISFGYLEGCFWPCVTQPFNLKLDSLSENFDFIFATHIPPPQKKGLFCFLPFPTLCMGGRSAEISETYFWMNTNQFGLHASVAFDMVKASQNHAGSRLSSPEKPLPLANASTKLLTFPSFHYQIRVPCCAPLGACKSNFIFEM